MADSRWKWCAYRPGAPYALGHTAEFQAVAFGVGWFRQHPCLLLEGSHHPAGIELSRKASEYLKDGQVRRKAPCTRWEWRGCVTP